LELASQFNAGKMEGSCEANVKLEKGLNSVGSGGAGEASVLSDKLLEEELIQLVSKESVREINIPKTDEFVINNRGQRLHVRTSFPNQEIELKCIIFALHGFSVHINHPVHRIFAREFNNRGIGYITLDFYGHGFSAGSVHGYRFMVESYEDLVDDCLSVISAAYAPAEEPKNGHSSSKTKSQFLLHNRSDSVPYFIMGQSMGGATALTTALELNFAKIFYASSGNQAEFVNSRNKLVPYITPKMAQMFAGTILMCPAISLNAPGFFVSFLLKAVFVPLFGQFYVPSVLQPPEFPPDTLTHRPELHRYSTHSIVSLLIHL
jgi:pimeloyl-ACP methyl ester carboxylesterase